MAERTTCAYCGRTYLACWNWTDDFGRITCMDCGRLRARGYLYTKALAAKSNRWLDEGHPDAEEG